MVLTAAIVWGLNGTVSTLLIRGGFDTLQLVTFRATAAFLGLLVFLLIIRGPRTLAASPRELPGLIAFGLLGVFAVPLLYFIGLSRMPVGIVLLFEYTAPVLVALWARFGQRQQVRRRLWAGLALAMVGVATVAQLWRGHLTLDGIAVAAALGSAVMLAVYYILGSYTVSGAAKGRARHPLSLTCWGFGVAATAGAIMRPWWHFPGHLLAGHSGGQPMWLLAVYLVVFGTIVPYGLTAAAMRHLPATSVGIVGMTEIVTASAFAWVLIGEALELPQIIGGLILVVGVALAESARVTRSDRGTEATPEAQIQAPRSVEPTVPAGR